MLFLYTLESPVSISSNQHDATDERKEREVTVTPHHHKKLRNNEEERSA